MKRSDRINFLAYRCLAIAGKRRDSQHSINHFCSKADRLFNAARHQRFMEGISAYDRGPVVFLRWSQGGAA